MTQVHEVPAAAVRRGVGRAHDHRYLHLLSETLPAYALCGGGIIISRAGARFPVDDPGACSACASILRAAPATA